MILGGLGCQNSKPLVNNKQPPDPLLISKKPVEGKPTAYTPSATPEQAVPVGYRSGQ
jgi:hypothetical protein